MDNVTSNQVDSSKPQATGSEDVSVKASSPGIVSAEATQLKKIEEDLKRIENEKDSILSIFGIWAGLIAFITVEFNFLKTLYSWQEFVGFSLIVSGLIFGFSMSLEILIRLGRNQKVTINHGIFAAAIAIVLLIGLAVGYWGNEHSREKKIDELASTKVEKESASILKNCDYKIDLRLKAIVDRLDGIEQVIGQLESQNHSKAAGDTNL